jgi:hypothetical protein
MIFSAAGTVAGGDVEGDCVKRVCDGAGGIEDADDPGDTPSDANPCTEDLCSNGGPSHPATDAGTACSGGVCDGSGACVECNVGGDCSSGVCDNHVCGVSSCANPGHLVIQQIRSRGLLGGNDEIVELYNPTSSPVVLDASWTLQTRSIDSLTTATQWTGKGSTIAAHGHFLIVGSTYAQQPAGDDTFGGVKDAASIRLVQGGVDTVDSVCFLFAPSIQFFDDTFLCEGSPADNAPHDNTTALGSNVDQSITRATGGCDTGDNAADFVKVSPTLPRSSSSP